MKIRRYVTYEDDGHKKIWLPDYPGGLQEFYEDNKMCEECLVNCQCVQRIRQQEGVYGKTQRHPIYRKELIIIINPCKRFRDNLKLKNDYMGLKLYDRKNKNTRGL